MAYVVTRPCRIGRLREPGEVLGSAELRGRSVRLMEDVERCIRFDPSVPEPAEKADAGAGRKPARGRKPAAEKAEAGDGEQSEDESSSED